MEDICKISIEIGPNLKQILDSVIEMCSPRKSGRFSTTDAGIRPCITIDAKNQVVTIDYKRMWGDIG